MDFDTLFSDYYTQYRAEATVPSDTDDEYTIAKRYANNGIRRWLNYDNTFWKELFTTAQTNSTGGVVTTTAGTASYAAPTAMKMAGGFVRLKDSSTGTTLSEIPIIDPQDAQFRSDNGKYAYFTGDYSNGFTLNINPAPDTTGQLIDYVYYKKPTEFSTGTDVTEMSNPSFLVDHMLASRFRSSRNPYYSTAKRDAENALGQMKMENDSGTWSNPWQVPDRSGSVWGANTSNSWEF